MTQPYIHRRSLRGRLAGWSPLGPIFSKELRTMARRKRNYLLRVGYLGVLLAMMLVAWLVIGQETRYGDVGVVRRQQQQAELGITFFGFFAVFSVIAMHLIGPVLTSTAIGAERLARTLNVLLMTPMTTWQIVAGKLFSRLLAAYTLLGLSLPVLAVVRLLGGIETADMFGLLGLCAATAACSAGLGLLLSTWLNRSYAVILLAYLAQGFVYFIVPLLAGLAVEALSNNRATTLVWLFDLGMPSNPLATTMMKVTPARTAGFNVAWWPAIVAQSVAAAACAGLAALVLRRQVRKEGGAAMSWAPLTLATANPPPLPTVEPSGAVPARAVTAAARTLDPDRRARLVGDNPVLWRELRRPLAARRWQRVLMSAVVLIPLGVAYFLLFIEGDLRHGDTHIGFALIFHTILMLLLSVIAATAVSGEKESDTWTLLIASPLSGRTIMTGKLLGVLRRAAWPTALVVVHFVIATLTGAVSVWALLTVIWVTVAFNAVWVMLGLYWSLKLRRATTAVVLNLVLAVLVYGGVPAALSVAGVLLSSDQMDYNSPYRRMEEAALLYLPHWYLGTSIDEFDGASFAQETIRMPLTRAAWPATEYLLTLLLVGILQLTLAAGIFYWMTSRFDAIVKRAKQRRA